VSKAAAELLVNQVAPRIALLTVRKLRDKLTEV